MPWGVSVADDVTRWLDRERSNQVAAGLEHVGFAQERLISEPYQAPGTKYIGVIREAISVDAPGTIERMKRSGPAKTVTRRRSLDDDEISAFHHIADGVCERVRLVRTNLLPPAADGMTIGRFVFMRDDHIEHKGSTLLAHELVHVRQFAEMGMPRFFSAYFGAYLKNIVRTRNHRQAYLDIPLEIEARREAGSWAKTRSNRHPKK